jgi:hypothetical protein
VPTKYKVTVEADPEEGGDVSGNGTYKEGATATVKAVAADGYTFVNWTEDGEEVSTDAKFSFEVTRDHALVAHFVAEPAPEKCKVIYDPNGGTINGKKEKLVIETTVGEVITIREAPKREGYTFKYWKGSKYYPGDKYTVPGDHTFVAQWEKKSSPTPSKSKTIPSTGDDSKPLVMLLSAMGLMSLLAIALAVPRMRLNRGRHSRR